MKAARLPESTWGRTDWESRRCKEWIIWCCRPRFCIVKAILGRIQPVRMWLILLWIMPLAHDRSLDLLGSSPALLLYHGYWMPPKRCKDADQRDNWTLSLWTINLALLVYNMYCTLVLTYRCDNQLLLSNWKMLDDEFLYKSFTGCFSWLWLLEISCNLFVHFNIERSGFLAIVRLANISAVSAKFWVEIYSLDLSGNNWVSFHLPLITIQFIFFYKTNHTRQTNILIYDGCNHNSSSSIRERQCGVKSY